MKKSLALFLLLLLTAWSQADDSPKVTLNFRVEPSTAEFLIQGTAEDMREPTYTSVQEPFAIDASIFKQGDVSIEFRAEGYETLKKTFDLKAQALSGSEIISIPPNANEPPISLTPKSRKWTTPALVLGSSVTLLAGLVLFLAQKRKESHEEKIRKDSVILPRADLDELIGKEVDGYRLESKLGRGGMANVYLASRPADRESSAVAIKLVHPHLTEDEEFQKRFQREVEISDKLRHKNIVTVLNAGVESGRYFIVLELIDGQDLRALIPESGMSLAEGLPFLRQTTEALFHAHKHGVVHRDIKPDNVLVKTDGTVKLSDFGLARSHQYTTVTATGSILGTPAYMAPEQVKSEELTELSDQYSLGIMAFYLFTGRLPFQDEDMMNLMVAHARREPPSLVDVKPELPPELDRIVLKMIAKNPGDRHQNLGVLLEQLKTLEKI
jgi:protein kinase-like protein